MKNKVKVPFYLDAGQEVTEIELENSGSNGYNGKWWEKIPDSTEYGTITQSMDAQGGEHDRKSEASGIQWLDHHSQAYNDDKTNRTHPQRHEVDKTDDGVKIKS
jgi:hypothetical protein